MNLRTFSQQEYSRLLDGHNARKRALSQSECEGLLMSTGATKQQAKNGAYVYLHHGDKVRTGRRGTKSEYEEILNRFDAMSKTSQECIRHLESLDFSYGQSKTAVYNYRVKNKLIGQ